MSDDLNNKTEWLSDFDVSIHLARAVQDDLAYLSAVVTEVGNEQLGQRLSRLSAALEEALQGANKAVSRMISEQVREGFDSIGRTFKAVLESVAKDDHANVQR